MRTYRQYCPIARASEIVAERWTPLIVRNLLFGAVTFSDIARGVPTMSRSMLTKRLAELEHAGVLTSTPKANGHGSRYELTEAGHDLAGVIDGLAAWGTRWLELTSAHTDPGFALWAWTHFQLARDALPQRRVVVAFTFPEERPANRRYWLLAERGDAELCYADPGGDPDAHVVARSEAFTRWHQGLLRWGDAVRAGDIDVSGPPSLVRSIPRWNTGPDHASAHD
jgi:DNA-binding HxlR family transcriptional regulator